jgi:hypothetical protein
VYARGVEDDYPDGQGKVRYYGWCTFLPRDYKAVDRWQIISQWKNAGSGSPPIFIRLQEMRISLMSEYDNHQGVGAIWTGAIDRGRWHRFVLRVKYGPTPETGSLKLWYDREVVLPITHRATMLLNRRTGRGLPNYWKLGLYRSADIDVWQSVFHDGAFVGKSHRAVARC